MPAFGETGAASAARLGRFSFLLFECFGVKLAPDNRHGQTRVEVMGSLEEFYTFVFRAY
jgi:hypothetical protein